jgi:hypothetical protein
MNIKSLNSFLKVFPAPRTFYVEGIPHQGQEVSLELDVLSIESMVTLIANQRIEALLETLIDKLRDHPSAIEALHTALASDSTVKRLSKDGEK